MPFGVGCLYRAIHVSTGVGSGGKQSRLATQTEGSDGVFEQIVVNTQPTIDCVYRQLAPLFV